jgi:hypothetical protein
VRFRTLLQQKQVVGSVEWVALAVISLIRPLLAKFPDLFFSRINMLQQGIRYKVCQGFEVHQFNNQSQDELGCSHTSSTSLFKEIYLFRL